MGGALLASAPSKLLAVARARWWISWQTRDAFPGVSEGFPTCHPLILVHGDDGDDGDKHCVYLLRLYHQTSTRRVLSPPMDRSSGARQRETDRGCQGGLSSSSYSYSSSSMVTILTRRLDSHTCVRACGCVYLVIFFFFHFPEI